MTVLIAGGGVGGLTLALSLHERGIPCIVRRFGRHVRTGGSMRKAMRVQEKDRETARRMMNPYGAMMRGSYRKQSHARRAQAIRRRAEGAELRGRSLVRMLPNRLTPSGIFDRLFAS